MQEQALKKAQGLRQSAVKRTAKSPVSSSTPIEPALQIQQTIGNHGVLRRSGPVIQAKLMIGSANDRYEREADQVAEQVMRMPEPQLLSQESDEMARTA